MNVPLRDAARAANARLIAPDALPHDAHVSTDSRTLVAGDAYLALRGTSFDGHHFASDAVAAGACAVIVDDEAAVPPGVAALVVADTTAAYLACAALARRRLRARVIAVTGSAGKTTTKAFLAQILEAAQPGRVVATHANENNEIGVAKLFLGAPEDAAYVVVEFGARHYGEIEPLARVALPDVAVLTNIGDAHLEIFGSPERLAQTKWGIFATGAHRVVAADMRGREPSGVASASPGDRTYFAVATTSSTTLVDEASQAAAAEGAATVTLVGRDRIVFQRGGSAAVEDAGAQSASHARDARASQILPTHVAIDGEHNLRNVAAAAAAAFAIGMPAAAIARALAALELPAGRYERLVVGDVAFLYDAYNASTQGTLATLASFARERAGRRIAVLGSMAELGPDAPAMHERVGAAAARAGCAYILVGGDFAADLARGALATGAERGRVVTFSNNAEAVAWLRTNVRPDDLVLLKASRRYRLEDIVAGLRDARANDETSHA
ncbi:MAG: UDP-N-acetylmuramoyl-tripeptide--D-alanyl-D-alanine ligase [Vulcanimicrobiaceae bacterium]